MMASKEVSPLDSDFSCFFQYTGNTECFLQTRCEPHAVFIRLETPPSALDIARLLYRFTQLAFASRLSERSRYYEMWIVNRWYTSSGQGISGHMLFVFTLDNAKPHDLPPGISAEDGTRSVWVHRMNSGNGGDAIESSIS
jgi:hypothetical protein